MPPETNPPETNPPESPRPDAPQHGYFRPLEAGAIIIGSLMIYRDHLRLLVLISLLPHLAMLGLEMLVGGGEGPLSPGVVGFILVATVVLNGITLAALTLAIGRALVGPEPGVLEAFALTFKRRVGAVVVAYLITALLVSGGMLFLFVPGVVLGGLFAPCIPAIAVERLGVMQGLQRSAALMRGQLLKGIVVFLYFLFIAGVVPFLLMVLQINVAFGPFTPLLSAIIGGVTLPLGFAASVLLYFSLRSATPEEAADLARALEAPAEP